jgi:solute carrier family 12 sodium/potassium/chloride transporter 2
MAEKKKKKTGSRKFGAFSGVFIPTFLSIIGVILFLRLGYIVGVAGVAGAIAIILLSVSVTLSTGLALSSITTNIRIGAGGAYSIISETFGLEMGGSVGIPLFLAQAFSVALYVFGFAETWAFLFPEHDFLTILLGAFLSVFLLVFVSTKLAVDAQKLVFLIVCLSLACVFFGGDVSGWGLSTPLVGAFREMPFWYLFALFFPAVTGLMAGVGMSGELSDPKRQIPKGVIYGLGVTTVIYLAMVLWLGLSATPAELIGDNLIVVTLSAFPQVVLAGILAATFSSALTTFVAAPRVLMALGESSILPFSEKLTVKTGKGEPRNAILVTGAIVVALLLIGSLNIVAQILTIFFLITYAMINIAVYVEQSLGLTSFRPTFKIPMFVTFYGAVSSVVIMFLINVPVGIASIAFVFLTYALLMNKKLKQKRSDVRSGLFREVSEWAARKVASLPGERKHVWKPNILVPVLTTTTLFGSFPLIKSIAYPHGTITMLGLRLIKNVRNNPEKEGITRDEIEEELTQLPTLVRKLSGEGIFTGSSTVEVKEYVEGIIVSLEAMDSQVFSPNILFLPFRPGKLSKPALKRIVRASRKTRVGTAIFDRDEELSLGSEKDVHVWISPRAMEKDFYEDRYFDLAALIAYEIQRDWEGSITLWMCVDDDKKNDARTYLKKLIYEARLPSHMTSFNVVLGDFFKTLKKAPDGDIHIIPFEESDINSMLKITKADNKSFLFVSDSGKEDILA